MRYSNSCLKNIVMTCGIEYERELCVLKNQMQLQSGMQSYPFACVCVPGTPHLKMKMEVKMKFNRLF